MEAADSSGGISNTSLSCGLVALEEVVRFVLTEGSMGARVETVRRVVELEGEEGASRI